MPLEIERKFLVHHQQWQQLEKPAGELFRQGYILTDAAKTIRVRITPSTAFLTIKGLTTGISRPEYEYEIPQHEAAELLDHFAIAELSKIRYKIKAGGHLWEVDEFLAGNAGLIVAEIELKSEEEKFMVPAWIADEVTEEEKYYNANLTTHPYSKW
ncbi:CYTH domain-containing protein [Ferruginibacter sp. HRS2-29]|uniref:CYTH domain-containing protein n=1 Tax=Ferruginibacter sp. HRS2-29 TaxID=2487334 RepID=UPI0020CDD73F|nr:CYTH domain-containing protein [Ferruginibacter sp. HRS2-29]MCP9753074.1 CYTH domain-containing protein [Ferruginibacter sp. HRS2-29]